VTSCSEAQHCLGDVTDGLVSQNKHAQG